MNVIEETKNGSQYYVVSLFPKDSESNTSQSQLSMKKIILWINEKNIFDSLAENIIIDIWSQQNII